MSSAMSPSTAHPLAAVLTDAVAGVFPPADGSFDVVPPDPAGTHAVVELTAHSYVLTDRRADDLRERGAHGFGGCTHPDVLRYLAGDDGWIGSLDVVLVAHGTGDVARMLRESADLDEHPRVVRSRAHRRDVRVFAGDGGLVTIGRGLVDRWEVSVELDVGTSAGAGVGRVLIAAGLAAVPPQAPVWAQVAPGNAASLRAFLASGFVPIGSEVLVVPAAVGGG